MKTIIPDEILHKIARAARSGTVYACVADTVSRRFRSVHNMSSILVCDCILLNLVLNKKITPNSADGIITSVRRENKSLYTTVDSAYFPVEDRFTDYAKDILGDDYEKCKNMRTTNFLVYVMSLDIERTHEINRKEALLLALDYDELKQYSFLLD